MRMQKVWDSESGKMNEGEEHTWEYTQSLFREA
jgi:hypothetical protein